MKDFFQTIGSFLSWLIGTIVILIVAAFMVSLLVLLPYTEENPEKNDWMYREIEACSTVGFPIDLEILGVEQMEYCYTKCTVFDMPFVDHSRYIESFANNTEATQHVVTLQCQVWESPITFLLSWKEYLLRRACGTRADAVYDYGAKEMYWLGNHLLLRYDDAVVLFYIGDSPAEKALLDNERAALLLREAFPGK